MLAINPMARLRTLQRHLEFAIYIRLLRPGDLIAIHSELIVALMAPRANRAQRSRSKEMEAFMRAFVTAIVTVLFLA